MTTVTKGHLFPNDGPGEEVNFTSKSIGVGRGVGGGRRARPPNNFGGGGNIPFGPPNNPPAFAFSVYVKQ